MRSLKNRAEDDLIFVNAWNEWAEGNRLEPYLHNGHGWLDALREELETELAAKERFE